jgi:hypothetical protein
MQVFQKPGQRTCNPVQFRQKVLSDNCDAHRHILSMVRPVASQHDYPRVEGENSALCYPLHPLLQHFWILAKNALQGGKVCTVSRYKGSTLPLAGNEGVISHE